LRHEGEDNITRDKEERKRERREKNRECKIPRFKLKINK